MDLILFTTPKPHVAVFTLNRPKAMNAVNKGLAERMEALIDQFEADDDLWIGIICSSHHKGTDSLWNAPAT